MLAREHLVNLLPQRMRNQVEAYFEAFEIFAEVRDPKVLRALGPSGVRGLLLHRGKQGVPTRIRASHDAHFDWSYPADQPGMRELYRRATRGQWNGETDLPWHISVDPLNPEVPIIPEDFFDPSVVHAEGVRLNAKELVALRASLATWMLSQFLHGEQGALFAAAQVTEAVQFFDGKLYGSTQVVDEGRHVEVFHRYLTEKLGKLYQINDNLFVIIDSLMADGRWDMKFLGMQIMIEGLALGAFGMIQQKTQEPLLKKMLTYVITDEARHVHYGVLALQEFISQLSDKERREREDWAFEVSLFLRNRFFAHEFYDEYYGHAMTRAQWEQLVLQSEMMKMFRRTMFKRVVPNLKRIGLLSDRIRPKYAELGLLDFEHGRAAPELSAKDLIEDRD